MKRTKEQLIEEIQRLEIAASKLTAEAGNSVHSIYSSSLFPKYLKIIRKVQKLRDQL